MKKDSIVARVTINSPEKMTPAGRRRIATWLKRQADDLVKHGPEYTNGRFTGKYMIATVVLCMLMAAGPVQSQEIDPCGSVLAPRGCFSLTAGAVTVVTRDARREFATMGGAFALPYRGFLVSAAVDAFGVQDGEAVTALGKQQTFRVIKYSAAAARNWNAVSFSLRTGLTYSIEGDQGAPLDPRMLDLKAQVELQLEKQGHISLWVGHDGAVGGSGVGADVNIPVAGGPAIVMHYELPFYRDPLGKIPWVVTGGGSVRLKSFSLY